MNKIKLIIDVVDKIIAVAGIVKTAVETLKKKELEDNDDSDKEPKES